MRKFHQDYKSASAPNLINHTLDRLGRLSYAETWAMLVAVLVAALLIDYAAYNVDMGIATIYIVPVCLAFWYLGAREGIAVTALVTLFTFARYPLLHEDPNVWVALGNGAIRGSVFGLIAMIVLNFRRCYDQVQFLASRDGMTGALNKESFGEQSTAMLDAARAEGKMLLMAFLDLDGFKAVNDRYGHEAGDIVLQNFAEGAATVLRRGDCFGRVGGDEFAALLPVSSAAEAEEMAEMLHRRFSAVLGEGRYAMTCSLGALIVPADYSGKYAALLGEADALMYAAKHAGKNDVRIAVATSSEADFAPAKLMSRPLVAS